LIQGVDPEALKAVLHGASADDITAILVALNESKGKNAAQVVHMLRKSAELKNWCDLWEVHLFDDGHVRVRAPKIGDREYLPNNVSEFTIQFMQIVKDAAEPKSLVIIMFTHGNAYLRSIDMVRTGLDDVVKVWGGHRTDKRIQVTAAKYSAVAP
jgi:hypothetical protein